MTEQTGSIPRSFIESLLARADVVQVINQRVPLKKAGNNFKACCPFHEEKTPSFNVSQTKQFYHCFGCGASGDAIKFLMDYDGLSFVEAVEALAAQYGMPVPREKLSPAKQKQQQERQQKQRDLYDVMHLVAKFYRHQLRDHASSEQAKTYLRERGLSPEIAKEFVIGFAPDGWDTLEKGLQADSKLKQQLVEVGMLVQKDNDKIYDRFRQRIMFPIRDGRGRVIAFGGRILGEGQPKYLNSPETPIFHKSNTLYGLFEMRQSRKKFEHILVVEGYMDVVALAQFGIRNAVATLGTATTVEHLELLFRQVQEVVFCFDGDEAGLKAAWKALELSLPLMEKERSVRFLFLDQGEDPDSTVRKEGVAGFSSRVAQALSLSDFLVKGLQRKLSSPMQTIEGRQQLVALAEPYVQAAHGLYQFLLAEKIAELVELPTWRVEKQMNVRSGFAQSGKAVNKSKAKPEESVKLVMTMPLRVFKVLIKRPQWAEIFEDKMVSDLLRSSKSDFRVLGGLVKHLKLQNFIVEKALQVIREAGYQDLLDFIVQGVMNSPDDDQLLMNEFEASLVSVAADLDDEVKGQGNWSAEDEARLQSLMQKGNE